jgi:hypothetical protein
VGIISRYDTGEDERLYYRENRLKKRRRGWRGGRAGEKEREGGGPQKGVFIKRENRQWIIRDNRTDRQTEKETDRERDRRERDRRERDRQRKRQTRKRQKRKRQKRKRTEERGSYLHSC